MEVGESHIMPNLGWTDDVILGVVCFAVTAGGALNVGAWTWLWVWCLTKLMKLCGNYGERLRESKRKDWLACQGELIVWTRYFRSLSYLPIFLQSYEEEKIKKQYTSNSISIPVLFRHSERKRVELSLISLLEYYYVSLHWEWNSLKMVISSILMPHTDSIIIIVEVEFHSCRKIIGPLAQQNRDFPFFYI